MNQNDGTSLGPHGQPIHPLSEEDPTAGHVRVVLEMWTSEGRGPEGKCNFLCGDKEQQPHRHLGIFKSSPFEMVYSNTS